MFIGLAFATVLANASRLPGAPWGSPPLDDDMLTSRLYCRVVTDTAIPCSSSHLADPRDIASAKARASFIGGVDVEVFEVKGGMMDTGREARAAMGRMCWYCTSNTPVMRSGTVI